MFLVQSLALLLFTGTPQAEAQTLTLGTRHTLDSQVLDEERVLLVHTPECYESGGRFPVLYLTDGPGHFLHTAGTLDFLSRNGRIPKMILVAIGNTDRTRDMTPTRAAMIRPDGEATDCCRRLGRRKAEELDLELRREESRHRRQRLAELADEPGGLHQRTDDETSLRVIQLETRLGELGAYVRAIHESRPWRAIQWVR